MAYTDTTRLESIQYEATELLDFATGGGQRQYAFELMVDSRELDQALDILTNLGTRIRSEIEDPGQVREAPAEYLVELDACPECGCTDIEVSAWVHANTNQVSNSEGPLDDAWCPQCESNGYESTFRARHAAKTTIEQPYQERTR